MKENLISIIVPVYKVESYINKCVDSILAQTYKDIEVILVDDGSPDTCPQICDAYAARDRRVTVIHKENGGLSDARNVGIERATGNYIMFVDSDDWIAPNMAEKLLRALEENGADLSICNFKYVSESGEKEYDNSDLPIKDECITSECYLNEKLFENKSHYWVISCCKLYKKQLFREERFDKGKVNEDEFILHRIITKCEKIACVSNMLYYYLQRDGSIMHTSNSVKKLDAVEALFIRAKDLAGISPFRSAAYKHLKRGIGYYYGYYKNFKGKLNHEQKARNNELQILYCDAYAELKMNKVRIPAGIRCFLSANRFSLKKMATIYNLFVK